MCLFLLFCGVNAGDATCEPNITCSVINDKILAIEGTGEMCYYSTSPSDFPWESLRNTLVQVDIHEGITTVDQYAFYNYAKLTTVTISNTVTKIGSYAFYNTGLLSIDIPGSVKLIDDFAFQKCGSLETVTMGEGVEQIGSGFGWSFSETGITEITIPASLIKLLGRTFRGASLLEAIHIHPDNTVYMSVDGLLLDKTGEILQRCPNGKKGSVEVPSGVTKISSEAFYGSTKITEVIVSDGVVEIGSAAFQDCYSLRTASLPNSVTSVGYQGFTNCWSLESVILSEKITTLSQWFFGHCGLVSIVLPESITALEASAFRNCTKLVSIVLPSKLKTIGATVFYGCTSLPGIVIPKTVTSFGNNVFIDCNELADFVYEGTSDPGKANFMYNATVKAVTVPWNYEGDLFCGVAIARMPMPTNDIYDVKKRFILIVSLFVFPYICM